MITIRAIGDRVDLQTFDKVCQMIGARECQFSCKPLDAPMTGYSVTACDGRQFFVETVSGRVYTMPRGMYICVINPRRPNEFSFDGKLENGQLLARLLALSNYVDIPELKRMVL